MALKVRRHPKETHYDASGVFSRIFSKSFTSFLDQLLIFVFSDIFPLQAIEHTSLISSIWSSDCCICSCQQLHAFRKSAERYREALNFHVLPTRRRFPRGVCSKDLSCIATQRHFSVFSISVSSVNELECPLASI